MTHKNKPFSYSKLKIYARMTAFNAYLKYCTTWSRVLSIENQGLLRLDKFSLKTFLVTRKADRVSFVIQL